MLAVLVFLFCWATAKWAVGSLVLTVFVHFASLLACMFTFPFGIAALRTSRFASFIGRRLARVNFDDESLKLLRALDPAKRKVFVVEPHGANTLGMALTIGAPGVDSMPEELATRCVVVAHWLLFCVPFVAQLFSLCGAVCCRPNFFLYRALTKGAHFALCPSGMEGKNATLRRCNQESRRYIGDKRVIHITRRNNGQLGFCSLAARNKAEIIPILSVDEDSAYWMVCRWLHLPQLVYPMGSFLFFPFLEEMKVRVGQPIDASHYNSKSNADMHALADHVYDSLKELARPDYCVLFE